MSEKTTEPRKLLVEWEYAPSLSFYGRRDNAAMAAGEDFPDWQRSHLAVDVRNLDLHRRFVLRFRHLVYERDSIDDFADEIEFLKAKSRLLLNELNVSETISVKVNVWYALTFGHSFEKMVGRIRRLFYSNAPELGGILGAEVSDVAFFVETKDDDWNCNLQIGPMSRDEWFKKVPYEHAIYRPADSGTSAFKETIDSIPDNVIHVRSSYWSSRIRQQDEWDAILDYVSKKCSTTVREFIAYYKG